MTGIISIDELGWGLRGGAIFSIVGSVFIGSIIKAFQENIRN